MSLVKKSSQKDVESMNLLSLLKGAAPESPKEKYHREKQQEIKDVIKQPEIDQELLHYLKHEVDRGIESAKKPYEDILSKLKDSKAGYFYETKFDRDPGHPFDPEAQFELAKKYESGDGLDKDLGNAFYYYNRSASQGYRPAIEAVRRLEQSSIDLLSDKKATVNQDGRSLTWLGGTSTNEGMADDIQGTGREIGVGINYQEDIDEALEALEEDEEKTSGVDSIINKLSEGLFLKSSTGNKLNKYNNGLVYWASGDRINAVDCFLQAAQDGHTMSRILLNKIRLEGKF